MKSMRTTFRIFAAAAAAALGILTSCQQQVLDAPDADGIAGKELVPVTLTASFIQTKADYTETLAKNLQPVWEADDKVIGFDENNTNYEFIVASVAADGSATLTGEAPANCTLHLIYLCGANKDEITSGSLSVSYDGQAGDKTMPAVMLADGNVFFGGGEFHFSNAGAVIGIDAVKGVPNSSTVSKITVYGDNLSAATIALSGSTLALTADGSTEESISTGTLSGVTVTDGIGTLSEQVLIAVPAGAKVKEVSVEIDSYIYSYALTTPATLAANQYSYVAGKTFIGHEFVEVGGLKWATCNVGATGSKDYGWYFSCGNTTGYINPSGSQWIEAKDNTCVLEGGFNNENYSHTAGATLVDNITAANDAACINWGRSWRMPTIGEFQVLYNATFWGWDAADTGFYVFLPGDVGKSAASVGTTEDIDKTKAKLFFPATGHGLVNGLSHTFSNDGYYSSSTLDADYIHPLGFTENNIFFNNLPGSNYRFYGFTVRPVVK